MNDFPFKTLTEAHDANQALLDQVFVDTLDGLFDSEPRTTFGCFNATSRCILETPVGSQPPSLPFGANDPNGTFVASTLFNNRLDNLDIHNGVGQAVRAADTSNSAGSTDSVFILWSVSGGNGGGTNPIPIPGTLYLILTGLLALTARRSQRC